MLPEPTTTTDLLLVDILRSSMNDGPGIRTTVFVKGCPLRCAWCHNPESQSPKPEISFDASRCAFCGKCADVCPSGVHEVTAQQHLIHRERCQAYGRCVSACPASALKLIGTRWTVQAVVDLVLRDKPYFDRSGGGLTVSGGEPMSQFQAVLEMLRLAKSAGIHTCLDTCGQAPLGKYLEILPYVDLFLWDYKATGEALHRELTGADGRQIRENLYALHRAGAKIRLRCPIVPGVNDAREHLQAIAQLSKDLPNLDGIDLMAYHSYARDKATRVGQDQSDLPDQPASPDQINHWLSELKSLGCERVTIG